MKATFCLVAMDSARALRFNRPARRELQDWKRGVNVSAMQHSQNSPSWSSRYSAKAMLKPVNFYCDAREAAAVSVAGDFNGWDAAAHPMQKQPDGVWYVQISLSHGHHHYWFVVDGKPVLDPRASGVGRNEKNERVSLLAVS